MIGQAAGHSRSTSHSEVAGFTQFLMGKTEIVRAANQVHPSVQSLHARSRVPTLACQARQSLTDGSIQPFNKGRIEHAPPHPSVGAVSLPDRADREPSCG